MNIHSHDYSQTAAHVPAAHTSYNTERDIRTSTFGAAPCGPFPALLARASFPAFWVRALLVRALLVRALFVRALFRAVPFRAVFVARDDEAELCRSGDEGRSLQEGDAQGGGGGGHHKYRVNP